MPLDNPDSKTASTAKRQQFALWFAEQGFPIIRLKPGAKEPVSGAGWGAEATTDPETIKGWFKYHPDMNYGVTGGDHHVIVDLDIKAAANGEDALAEEAAKFGDYGVYAETLTARSPSGGKHLFYRVDSATGNANRFPIAIDVRGKKGYVVGVGSELVEDMCKPKDTPGSYTVEKKAKIAAAPDWMRDYFRPADERAEQADVALYELDLPTNMKRARDFLERREIATEGSGGNEQTYVTFCKLKDFGLSLEKAVEIVCEEGGWNDRCDPPWDIDELTAPAGPATNAYRYGRQQPGIQGMDEDPFGIGAATAEDLKAAGMQDVGEEVDQEAMEDAAAQVDAEQQAKKANSIAESWRRVRRRGAEFNKRPRAETFISEWLPAYGLVGLVAKRGCGKTTVLVDMALSIATDEKWMNTPTRQGLYVIFVVGESAESAADLIEAWCKRNGLQHPPERFICYERPVNLMSDDDCDGLIQVIREDVPKGERAVVVIDTWQRSTGASDQRDEERMSAAVDNAERIGKAVRGPTVAAFHPPKRGDLTISGSGVIENKTSAIWHLSDQTHGKHLEVDRIKGRGEGNYVVMQFVDQAIEGEDEFGQPRLSQVAVRKGGTELTEAQQAQQDAKKAAYARLICDRLTTWDTEADGSPVVATMAKLIAGEKVDVDGKAHTLPGIDQLRKNVLPKMFDGDGFDLGDGKRLALIQFGKPVAGKESRTFQVASLQ